MAIKVLIPTGGRWENLWEITNFINKSLIKLGKKPWISYIIDAYPDDTEFVITIGYLGNQVQDFLSLVYPNKKITIVEADNTANMIESIMKAKEYLQSPFIYHACDTIVLDTIELLDGNWIWGYTWEASSNYAGFNVLWKSIEHIHQKWTVSPDFIHIGLVKIEDYISFWQNLENILQENTVEKNDSSIINKMIWEWKTFQCNEFKLWYDTWNIEWINKAKKEFPDSFHILHKLEESIYIYDTFVVKFFHDSELATKRVQRAEFLKWLVPDIQWHRNNFFRYSYAKGHLFSRVATPKLFEEFFHWSKTHLWKENHEVSDEKFREVCYDFYYTKSIKRINKLMESYNIKDEETIINWEKVPQISELFKLIDFQWLCGSKQTLFHGDYILDNILYDGNQFILLDWRQDFWWLLQSGDMYYDLWKLNHNLVINHDIVNADLFTIDKISDEITVDIQRKNSLVECQETLHTCIIKAWLDVKKVKVLSALIWLNMSPLHHHPFDKFLFYFWKYNLWKALNEKN